MACSSRSGKGAGESPTSPHPHRRQMAPGNLLGLPGLPGEDYGAWGGPRSCGDAAAGDDRDVGTWTLLPNRPLRWRLCNRSDCYTPRKPHPASAGCGPQSAQEPAKRSVSAPGTAPTARRKPPLLPLRPPPRNLRRGRRDLRPPRSQRVHAQPPSELFLGTCGPHVIGRSLETRTESCQRTGLVSTTCSE